MLCNGKTCNRKRKAQRKSAWLVVSWNQTLESAWRQPFINIFPFQTNWGKTPVLQRKQHSHTPLQWFQNMVHGHNKPQHAGMPNQLLYWQRLNGQNKGEWFLGKWFYQCHLQDSQSSKDVHEWRWERGEILTCTAMEKEWGWICPSTRRKEEVENLDALHSYPPTALVSQMSVTAMAAYERGKYQWMLKSQ